MPARQVLIINDSFSLFVGGTAYQDDIATLRKGCQIAVGTVGRLADLAQKKHLKMDNVQFFALDEADKLMDDCFSEGIK